MLSSNKEVWAIAVELISTHGTGAEIAAGLCLSHAEEVRKGGDALKWQSVLVAIEELLKPEPDYDEWPN
jgi:hypothetical protein